MIDKTNPRSALNKNILATPGPEAKRRTLDMLESDLKPYVRDQKVRNKVKRSIAHSSMAK